MKYAPEKKPDRSNSTFSLFELLLAVATLILVIAMAEGWAFML